MATPASQRVTTGGLINYQGVDHVLKHAIFAGTGAATTAAVAAVTGFKLRVVGWIVSTGNQYTFVTKTATPTSISAVFQAAAFAVPFQVVPINEHGYFEGQAGENIGVTHSAGTQMDIYYIETAL